MNRGNCQTQEEYCEDHNRSGKSVLITLADLYGIRPEDSIVDELCQNEVNSQSKVKWENRVLSDHCSTGGCFQHVINHVSTAAT